MILGPSPIPIIETRSYSLNEDMGVDLSREQPTHLARIQPARVQLTSVSADGTHPSYHSFTFLIGHAGQCAAFRIRLRPDSQPEWRSLLEARPNTAITGVGSSSRVRTHIRNGSPYYILSAGDGNDTMSVMVPVPWLQPSIATAIELAAARGALVLPVPRQIWQPLSELADASRGPHPPQRQDDIQLTTRASSPPRNESTPAPE